MNIIYLAIALILGSKFLQGESQKSNEVRTDKENKNMQVAKTRKTFTTYIKNNEPGRQIKPEDININIKPELKNLQETPGPNFIALTVLWSHFEALENNILKENLPAPWEQYEENRFISNKKTYLLKQKRWRRFLEEIIEDKSWVRWINNPREVRKRSLDVYEKIN